MIVAREKPAHWAQAFGLAAASHVGALALMFGVVIDLEAVLPNRTPTASAVQITSLALDTDHLSHRDIGTGDATQNPSDTLAPLAPEATALAPVPQAETVVPAAQARAAPAHTTQTAHRPETASPLRPSTPTLLAPVSARIAPPATVTARSARTVTPALAPVPPDAPKAEENAAPPPSTAALPPAEAPDPLTAELIARIRGAVGEACLIALPRQNADGPLTLQVFTATESAAAHFANMLLDGLTPRPAQETILVDPRQCAALDYIRNGVTYPTSSMPVTLDAGQIPSGTELTGLISATGGRNVALLLVDDNGVVQDLGSYLSVAVNTARFTAPLRRVGTARDTRQLLLALGTDQRPAALTSQNGQTADTFFEALTTQTAENAIITLAPFEVR